MLKRIVIHWTAGSHKPGATDRRHYHFIIGGAGDMDYGDHSPEANIDIKAPKDGTTYAAHTRGMNTGSIGVAMAAMGRAKERPFDPGPWPITREQTQETVRVVATLCLRYGIPVTRETVLTHAEVEPTLGVKQRGKWDVTWLPGMAAPGDPVAVGDELRRMVEQRLRPTPVPSQHSQGPRKAPAKGVTPAKGLAALVGALIAALAAWLGFGG